MKCTINDINLSFDKEDRLRKTIMRISRTDANKAAVLAGFLVNADFKRFLFENITSEDVLKNEAISFNTFVNADYLKINQNKLGSLLTDFYKDTYLSIDNSRTIKGMGKLDGFTSAAAKTVAKNYTASLLIDEYRKELSKSRDARRKPLQIIADVNNIIVDTFYKRVDDFITYLSNKENVTDKAKSMIQQYIDLVNELKQINNANAEDNNWLKLAQNRKEELEEQLRQQAEKGKEAKKNKDKIATIEAKNNIEEIKQTIEKVVNDANEILKKKKQRNTNGAIVYRNRYALAQNLVTMFTEDYEDKQGVKLRNYANLVNQCRANADSWYFQVFNTKNMTSVIKDFNNVGDIEEFIEAQDENNDEITDKFNEHNVDETAKSWEDNLYKNFNQTISGKLRIILSTIPKLSDKFNPNDNVQAVDTENELGVATYMDAQYLTVQIYSFGDFSSVESLIVSLEAKSQSIKSLYGLGQLVSMMKNHKDFANFVYANFAKPIFNKTILTISDITNENGIDFSYSNPNTFPLTELVFRMSNKLRATYNSTYDDRDVTLLSGIYKQFISDKNKDTLNKDLFAVVNKYFPNFNKEVFNNYFDNIEDAAIEESVNKLIRSLQEIIRGVASLKKAINNKTLELDNKYREERNRYNVAIAKYNNLNPKERKNVRKPEFPVHEYVDYANYDLNKQIYSGIISFSEQIINYTESRARLNSTNAEGNSASNVLKNCYVTRLFDQIMAGTKEDSNAGLKNLYNYITQGTKDGSDNQYSNNPLFFGVKDENGRVIVPGMFTKTPTGYIIADNAKEILKSNLFDGTKNTQDIKAASYASMSKIDFFITQYIAFRDSVYETTKEGKIKNIGNTNSAVYSMRIGSDAPKIFFIRAPRYTRNQVQYAIYGHVLDELNMFVKGLTKIFTQEANTVANDETQRIFKTRTDVDNLIGRAFFDEKTADKLKQDGKTDMTPAIVKDGKLRGNLFKFLRLFEVNGYDAGKKIEAMFSLYGGSNEGSLISVDEDGRLRLNPNNIIVYNESTKKFELNLSQEQKAQLKQIIREWTDNFLTEAKSRTSGFVKVLTDNNIPFDNTTLDDFLLNSVNMNMNYDDLFEGDYKYYSSARDFLKRTKESQAGGDGYAGYNITEEFNTDIKDLVWQGNPEAIQIDSKQLDDSNNPVKEQVVINNKRLIAKNGFRGVTIYNVVKTSDYVDDLQKELERIFIEQGFSEESAHERSVKIASGYGFAGGDVTKINDAQSYITFEEFIRRKWADGTINDYADLIRQLTDDTPVEEINLDEVNARIQVQKNFYYDKVFDEETGLFYPRQIKNAEFVLIPKLLPKDSELRKIHDWMQEHNIGQLNTAETSKAAKKNIFTIWDAKTGAFNENFAEAFDESYVENYYYQYLYKQQDVPQHMMDEHNKAGIQIMKKIIDNIINEEDSDNPKRKQLIKWADEFQDAYTANIKEDFEHFIDAMGWKYDTVTGTIVNAEYATTDANGDRLPDDVIETNRTTLNFSNFYTRAREEAARLGMDSNFMEYLIPNEFGDPNMPNFMNIVTAKLESVAQSIYNNKITRQILPGWHAAQITGVGYSKRLKFDPKTGVMEVYLPRWSKLIPKTKNAEEEAALIKQIQEEGLDIHIGYRIPTEGKQSISVLRVVGFTNEALGSTIVVADEWVTQTGSDFDVDSVYGICWEMYAIKDKKTNKISLHKIPFEENTVDEHNLYINYVRDYIDAKIKRTEIGGDIETSIKELKDRLNFVNERGELNEEYKEIDDKRNALFNKLPGWARGISKDIDIKAKRKAKKDRVVIDIRETYPEISHAFLEYLEKHNVKEEDADTVREYVDYLTAIIDVMNRQDGLPAFDKEEYLSKKVEAIQAIIKRAKDNQFAKYEDAAKQAGLLSFEEWSKKPFVERLNRRARNNYIIDRMIKIMNDETSREEQYGRSNFDNITNGDRTGANDIIDRISGKSKRPISPYNPLDQLDYFEDAMGGARLKALSVMWDTFVSKNNRVRAFIADEDAVQVIIENDVEDSNITYNFDEIKRSYAEDVSEETNKDNTESSTVEETNKKEIDRIGKENVIRTIDTLNSDNNELSENEKEVIKAKLGNRPRVLIASEATDPVFHSKQIKKLVEDELAKPIEQRRFHMMYLITKHDGIPFKELAELKIPKFVHFSITSLGGSKYEPGVMKMDDLLDRIETFIKDGVLNPNLVTIRIDPIIPGVTKKEDIRHIIERAKAMGISQFKFSLMDSYGNYEDRFIVKKMRELNYPWETYYNVVTNSNGRQIIDFNPKQEYINDFYSYMDNLAEEFNIKVWTCGENPKNITLKRVRTNVGCVNVEAMNKAMGTTDISYTRGRQRKDCSCYGNKVDACDYGSTCASSCVYCYAKHNGDAVMRYYDENGNLLDNDFTRTVKKVNKENKTTVANGVGDAIYSYVLYTGTQEDGSFTEGGDKIWAEAAKELGIKTVGYSQGTLRRLNAAQLAEVENAYRQAVADLGRKFLPLNAPGGKSVRRDYLQAKAGDAIFAIGRIVYPGQRNNKGYVVKSKTPSVDGGTGYAVQMAINMNKPVHVFDYTKKKWYIYDKNKQDFVEEQTPQLTPRFTGIGTRDVADKDWVKDIIKNVYRITKDGVTENTKEEEKDSISKPNNKKRLVLTARRLGWSRTNRNIVGALVTTYTSQTTAHHLDAVKMGSVPNVDEFTFGTYKYLSSLGIDFENVIAFMRQPIITNLVYNNNLIKSTFVNSSNQPIKMTIVDIAKKLGIRNGKYEITYNISNNRLIDAIKANSNFVQAFNTLFGIDISTMNNDDILNIKLPLDKSRMFARIKRAAQNKGDIFENAAFDFGILLTFRNIQKTAEKINKYISATNADKFGAKPSIHETINIIEQINELRGDYTLSKDDIPFIELIFPSSDEYHTRINIEDSKYKSIAAVYAYATNPSIQTNTKIFVTENDDFNITEKIISQIIHHKFTEPEYKEYKRYIIAYLYNQIEKLLTPLTVDKKGRIILSSQTDNQSDTELKTAPDYWNAERSRICGYGITIDGDFEVKNVNKPTKKDIEAFSKLTPAQKVLFIQRHFNDNQGIFNYIKVTLLNNTDVKYRGISRQYLSYDDQVYNIEDLLYLFTNSFSNRNSLIKLAAIDLIKYAFIAEGFNFRSGYISKIIPNETLYSSIENGGMDIIDELKSRVKDLPFAMRSSEFIDMYVRSHSDIVPIKRLPPLPKKIFNVDVLEEVYSRYNESTHFLASTRADKLVHIDATINNILVEGLVSSLNLFTFAGGYIKVAFPIDENHSKTVLYRVEGRNEVLDNNGNVIAYKDYFLVPLNLLDKYETYEHSYNKNYNIFNSREYYDYVIQELTRQIASARDEIFDLYEHRNDNEKAHTEYNKANNAIRENVNRNIPYVVAPIGQYNTVEINLGEDKDGLMMLYDRADELTKGGVRNLVDGIVDHYVNSEDNFSTPYCQFNPNISLKRFIPSGTAVTQNIVMPDGTTVNVTIAHHKITEKFGREIEQMMLGRTDAGPYAEAIKGIRSTQTLIKYADIYRVTKTKVNPQDNKNNALKAATDLIVDSDESVVTSPRQTPRRGRIDVVSSAIINEISYDARKNNTPMANAFIHELDRFHVNRNMGSSLVENRGNIYRSAARYYRSAANAIINKLEAFQMLDKDGNPHTYKMDDVEMYEALAMHDEYFRDVADIILRGITFGNRIVDILNLDISAEDLETKKAIEEIINSINSIRQNKKLADAMNNIINVYFKKYSTNPEIVRGVLELRESFGDLDKIDSLIADPTDIDNNEVQVILKQVYSMLSKAEMFDTKRNVQEWRDKLAEIEAMSGSVDLNKIIDSERGMIRQAHNAQFLEDKQRVIDELNEAYNNKDRSFEDFKKYIIAKYNRDKFMYENTEQHIVDNYYAEDIALRTNVMRDAGDAYIRYMQLSQELYNTNSGIDNDTEENANRKRRIISAMQQLRSEVDIDGSEKSEEEKAKARALTKYINKRKELIEKYFDTKEYDGFQEDYIRYKNYIDTYNASHKFDSLEKKLADDVQYREAYNWIKSNGHVAFGKEESIKLRQAFKTLTGRVNVIRNKTMAKLKAIEGVVDESGMINPMKLTNEQIAQIKDEEMSDLSRMYDNSYTEGVLIKDVPNGIPLMYPRPKKKDDENIYGALKYEDNAAKFAIITEINKILSKCVDRYTGNIDVATLFNNAIVSDAERVKLAKLYQQLRNLRSEVMRRYKKRNNAVYMDATNNTAFLKAMNYYKTNLQNTKQGIQFLNIFTELDSTGNMVANSYIYGYRIPTEEYTDYERTEALQYINENVDFVTNEYYEIAMRNAQEQGEEAYNKWFKLNHIYNPYSHRWEPLKIWTKLEAKPGSDLAKSIEYIPSFDNMERSVKEEYVNNEENRRRLGLKGKGYKEFTNNYKKGNPRYDTNIELNAKEEALRELYIETLNKYATTYQGKRFVGQGYLPRERKNEIDTRWAAGQTLALLGASWHSGADSDSFYKEVDYSHDREAEMKMLTLLKGKGTQEYKSLPIKGTMSDEKYAKEVAKVREENRKIKEANEKIDNAILNRNWNEVMEDFIHNATIFNSRQSAKPYLYLLLEDLSVNNAYMLKGVWGKRLVKDSSSSTDDDTSYMTVKQTRTREIVHTLARRLLYGQYHEKNTYRSIANFLQNLTSAKYMIFNAYGGVANITTGKVNIAMEEYANEYFGFSEFASAQKQYLLSLPDIIATMYSEKSHNITTALIKYFNVVDFDQMLQFGAGSENLDEKLKRVRNWMYSFQSGGEHYMQNSVLIAMLKSNRLYTDKDGVRRIGDFKDFTWDIERQAMEEVLKDNEILLTNYKTYLEGMKDAIKLKYEISTNNKDLNRNFLYSLRDSINPSVQELYKKTAKAYHEKRNELMKEAKEQFSANPTVESLYTFKDGMAVLSEKAIVDFNAKGKNPIGDLEHLIAGFREKVISVNKKIHGVYDKNGAAQIETKWWGSLVMQYHKHLYNGIFKRWRKKGFYSEFRGSKERASYLAFSDFMFTEFTNFKERVNNKANDTNIVLASIQTAMESAINTLINIEFNWNNLSNWEKANIKRNLGDISGVLVAALVVMALYGLYDEDDIKDDKFKASLLYLADRLYSDSSMYSPVGLITEYKTAWSSPIASANGPSDLIKAMMMIPQALFDPNFSTTYQSGQYAGKNKFKVLLRRNTPGLRPYDRIQLITRNNKYYKVGESQIGVNIAKNFGQLLHE